MTVSSIVDWVSVSPTPLSPDDLVAWAVRPECGAVVTFCGTARSTSTNDHEIQALEYETSVELAQTRIAEVVASARSRWPELGAVAIHHRVGVVAVTEPAVVIVVSSPHRREAFDAAQFCIDTVKRCVPMWKREMWEGVSAWSEEAQPIVSIDDV
jgi:molybdopterin synthase catalytic subunit